MSEFQVTVPSWKQGSDLWKKSGMGHKGHLAISTTNLRGSIAGPLGVPSWLGSRVEPTGERRLAAHYQASPSRNAGTGWLASRYIAVPMHPCPGHPQLWVPALHTTCSLVTEAPPDTAACTSVSPQLSSACPSPPGITPPQMGRKPGFKSQASSFRGQPAPLPPGPVQVGLILSFEY